MNGLVVAGADYVRQRMPESPRLPTDPRFAPPTPFARLLYTHGLSACGDACFAVSLAGSLFFASPANSSREKLLLYLVIVMLPFAIILPFLGPALDRTKGGRRLVVTLAMVGRAVLCIFMSRYILKDAPEGLLIYPFAFGVLVLQKSYSVAKSSLVPSLVDDDSSLVRANSRLALISVLASFAGAAPGALAQIIFDADASLVLAAFIFGAAAVVSLKIPQVQVRPRPPEEVALEQEELHQPSILLAGSVMGVLRSSVGFLFFFSAFSLKDDLAAFGLAGGFAFAGVFLGNFVAPILRARIREEVMIASAIGAAAVMALLGGVVGGTFGFAIAGLIIGVSASSARLGFDSLLQRDGPDAVRGRAFARFETRFQAMWVAGALLGLIPLDARAGLLGLAAFLLFVAVSYVAALRAQSGRVYRTTVRPPVVDRVFVRAKTGVRDRYQRSRAARRKAAAEKRATRERPGVEQSKPQGERTR
jgi:hypothetical protein